MQNGMILFCELPSRWWSQRRLMSLCRELVIILCLAILTSPTLLLLTNTTTQPLIRCSQVSTMATSWISDLLFALFVFMSCVQFGSCRSPKFIRWDDIKLDVYESRVINDDRKVELRRNRVIVVDKNGGGDSVTVQGAVDMVPEQNNRRVKIHILPGVYREKVIVPSSKPYVSFIGNASFPSETRISWDDKASDRYIDGSELGTYRTASVLVEGDYFCATGITFENTMVAEPGGKGEQAVALRVAAERSMFYKVRILGSQDTLFDESGTHYFYRSHIRGSIDFICGQARSLFQRCVLESVANSSGAIAAHRRQSPDDDTGELLGRRNWSGGFGKSLGAVFEDNLFILLYQ